MLHRIKMENMSRSAGLLKQKPQQNNTPNQIDFTLVSDERNTSLFEQLLPRKFFPISQSLSERIDEIMGSFTSQPKIIPAGDAQDTDVEYPQGREELKVFLAKCVEQLGDLPAPIERNWRKTTENAITNPSLKGEAESETFRVFQWNVLSQTLGTKNDNFVKCPPEALNWRTRRYRMLEEIARHDPDVVCLQEVDHFRFLRKSLAALGYQGHFFPKPDSPCLYLPENAGPDGCAVFFKKDKFDLVGKETRVIEVWCVQSNQVVLLVTLRSRSNDKEVCFATTHLKARNGALLSTLRNEQGKDLIEFLGQQADGRPLVCTGDFNAEPDEPVYETMTESEELRLSSAYETVYKEEPKYTTWKIREDGEHIQTLDYMFYTSDLLSVDGVLDFPSGEEIGEKRLPSPRYASDHFSLVADFKFNK